MCYIIDGEVLKLECKTCGRKYDWIVGYGPICPTRALREKMLKEHPPVCPECGSNDYCYADSLSNFLRYLSKRQPKG